MISYNIFFLYKIIATIIERTTLAININDADKGLLANSPKGTFIPKKELIIVGTLITIVAPAKNFIISFRLWFQIVQ